MPMMLRGYGSQDPGLVACEGLRLLRPLLCADIITRNLITNALPTRTVKSDMLRTTSALGAMSVSKLLTLWCFLLSCTILPPVVSPFSALHSLDRNLFGNASNRLCFASSALRSQY